jgi:hypothetical protein
MLLAFAGISASDHGFFVSFHPPFERIDQGEATLWVAASMLLAPAGALLGYGFSPMLADVAQRMHRRLSQLTERERHVGFFSLVSMGFVVARLANALVLLGYPITDDEWAARFGGEMLANGRAMLEIPFALTAFPSVFMFIRGNTLTSMDWLGTQLAWAVSTLTNTGNLVFALSATTALAGVIWVLHRKLSATWALVGAALFMTSPMAFGLSMTTHGHLHSRALWALLLAAQVALETRPSRGAAALRGVVLGLSLVSRPFETAFFAAPFLVNETINVFKGNQARRRDVLLSALFAVPPLVVFFAHSYWVTKGFFPPRHSEGSTGAPQYEFNLWVVFGSNSAFNLMRLCVFFAGPIGVVLVGLGVLTDRFSRLLALGVLSVLALGLFHDNYGIHAIGPIHYSECAVPLTLLAIFGLANITRRTRTLNLDARVPAVTATFAVLLSCVGFDFVQSVALNDSAHIQADIYDDIEAALPRERRPAVLLAPQFSAVWRTNPHHARRGSWVFEWRRPHPDFSDEVLILRSSKDGDESVRAAFAGRQFFRLVPSLAGPTFFRLVEEQAAP